MFKTATGSKAEVGAEEEEAITTNNSSINKAVEAITIKADIIKVDTTKETTDTINKGEEADITAEEEGEVEVVDTTKTKADTITDLTVVEEAVEIDATNFLIDICLNMNSIMMTSVKTTLIVFDSL